MSQLNCTICKCGAPLSNLGFDCTNPFAVPVMAVFVPTYDSTGALNGIPKTQILNKTYFDSMTAAAKDPTQRWYPSPQFKNVVNSRADAKFWTADDESVEFVSESARKFTALVTQRSGSGATAPEMKKQIESARCSSGLSVFLISRGRQILCKDSSDGLTSLPIEIDVQSIYAGFVSANNTQNQHLALSFNFSASENDGDLKTIECSELQDYDILNIKALRNGCSTLITEGTTSIKIKISTGFGSSRTPVLVEGLVIGDFVSSSSGSTSKIYNATDGLDVTITSAVEAPKGTYLISFVAQTVGDVLIPYAIKTGYDFQCMKNNAIELS